MRLCENILIFLVCTSLLQSVVAHAQVTAPNLDRKGVISPDTSFFIDEKIDYSRFSGRVSDKSDDDKILKIRVENNNSKFFRAGDLVYFKIQNYETVQECKAYVRDVEDFYFVILVQDYGLCWDEEKYFRRGNVINFRAPILAQRVFEGSKYREMLLIRKEDFLKQLNGINNFLWSFDQQKVKTAIRYDEKVNKLEKEKRRSIDNLIIKKKESLTLQNELMRKLNSLDESLKYYRVERQELLTDRWDKDHAVGLPFGQRPMKIKKP
jgi:hypothetical protein